MKWGFFGPAHIATLVAAVALVIGLYYLLKNKTQRTQVWVLGLLSLSGMAAIIYNLVTWGEPLEYLPLHLCSLNALALPFAVSSRNKTLCNLLLVWSLGALVALVLNQAVMETELFGSVFCFYYFPHVVEFGVPILLFRLGLVKKDVRCIPSTIGITMAAFTLIHLANKLINFLCLRYGVMYDGEPVQVNYMYSIVPENPVLQMFYKVIPYEYWYMYMIVPILVAYLLLVYAPGLFHGRKPPARPNAGKKRFRFGAGAHAIMR